MRLHTCTKLRLASGNASYYLSNLSLSRVILAQIKYSVLTGHLKFSHLHHRVLGYSTFEQRNTQTYHVQGNGYSRTWLLLGATRTSVRFACSLVFPTHNITTQPSTNHERGDQPPVAPLRDTSHQVFLLILESIIYQLHCVFTEVNRVLGYSRKNWTRWRRYNHRLTVEVLCFFQFSDFHRRQEEKDAEQRLRNFPNTG